MLGHIGVGVQSTKARGRDTAEVTIDCLYKVVYEVSISAKMYDPERPLSEIQGFMADIHETRLVIYLRNRLPVGGGCVYVLQLFFVFFVHQNYETTVLGNG